MKIGIDGRYQGQPLTGVPRYIDELCKQLDVLLPDAHFFVYAASQQGINLPSTRWTIRSEPNARLSRLKPNIWWKFFAHRLIRKDGLDVLWAGAGFLPLFIGKLRTVLTVYDLTFRLYPETMSRANLWAHRLFFANDLRRADSVVAISQGTSRRMAEFYGRSADAIVRPDAADRFRPVPEQQRAPVLLRYGLTAPFILAVSTLEPRKNFPALIQAFLILKRSGQIPKHELVLIGKKGWRDSSLAQQIGEHEGSSIRSLGFVPDEDLPALYTACDVFCMPSLYEGFGIPVLEARRCGARVVATDIEELREAGDDETTYCHPTSSSIANAIQATLSFSSPLALNFSDGWSNGARILLHTVFQLEAAGV